MPLTPENNERLKKVIKSAAIAAAGTMAVKYARKENHPGFSFIYLLERARYFKFGYSLDENGKEGKVSEFSGEMSSWPDPEPIFDTNIDLSDEQVELLETFEWQDAPTE